MAASPRWNRSHRAVALAGVGLSCAACLSDSPAPPTTLPPESTTTAVASTTLSSTTTGPAPLSLRIGVTAGFAYGIPFVLAS